MSCVCLTYTLWEYFRSISFIYPSRSTSYHRSILLLVLIFSCIYPRSSRIIRKCIIVMDAWEERVHMPKSPCLNSGQLLYVCSKANYSALSCRIQPVVRIQPSPIGSEDPSAGCRAAVRAFRLLLHSHPHRLTQTLPHKNQVCLSAVLALTSISVILSFSSHTRTHTTLSPKRVKYTACCLYINFRFRVSSTCRHDKRICTI